MGYPGSEEARDHVLSLLKRVKREMGRNYEIVLLPNGRGASRDEPLQSLEWRADEAPEPVADEIVEYAEQAAQEMDMGPGTPGKVLFTVEVPEEKKRVTIAICLREPDEDGDEWDETEFATTPRALVGQQMQHNQALIKVAVGSSLDNQRVLLRENERLRTRIDELEKSNDKLRGENLERVKVFEEFLTRKNERDIANRTAEAAEQRKDAMMREFIPMASVAFNHFVGRKLLGSGAAPSTNLELLFKSFGDSIRPEQLDAIRSLLDSGQNMALMEMFMLISNMEEQRKKQEEEAAAQRGVQANGAPAAAATNGVGESPATGYEPSPQQ